MAFQSTATYHSTIHHLYGVRSNFISLPHQSALHTACQQAVNNLSQSGSSAGGQHAAGPLVLSLQWQAAVDSVPRTVYVAWSGSTHHSQQQHGSQPSAFAASAASSGSTNNSIGVPAELAQSLQLPSDTRVQAQPLSTPYKPLAMLEVQPSTSDDWEIIEQNANDIEMNLLQQMSVVNTSVYDSAPPKFPYYVRNRLLIYLQPVLRADDKEHEALIRQGYVRLAQNSEISVVPIVRKRPINTTVDSQSINRTSAPPPPLRRFRTQPTASPTIRRLLAEATRTVYVTYETLDHLLVKHNGLVLLSNKTSDATYSTVVRCLPSNYVHANHIIVSPALQVELHCSWCSHLKVQAVYNDNAQAAARAITSIRIQPVTVFDSDGRKLIQPHNTDANASQAITQQWQQLLSFSKHPVVLMDGSYIDLTAADDEPQQITISPAPPSNTYVVHVNAANDANTSHNQPTQSSTPRSRLPSYHLLTSNDIHTHKPTVVPTVDALLTHDVTVDVLRDDHLLDNKASLADLGGVSQVTDSIIHHLSLLLSTPIVRERCKVFGNRIGASGGTLLMATTGLGKTAIVHAVARYFLLHSSIYAFPLILHGSELCTIGKTSTIVQRIKSTFKLAMQRSPALIIIDDIDILLPNPASSDGSGAVDNTSIRSSVIAELLNDLLLDLRTKYSYLPVAVTMTCKSVTSVHPALQTQQLLTQHLTMKTPDADSRYEILSKLLQRQIADSNGHLRLDSKLDLHRIALKCQDGMTPLDLQHIVHRTVHTATTRYLQQQRKQTAAPKHKHKKLMHGSADQNGVFTTMQPKLIGVTDFTEVATIPNGAVTTPCISIKHTDAEHALVGYEPTSLKDLHLTQQTQPIKWSDIGALRDVKQLLKDTLELPSKFQRLFSTIPIKLRSGILLYGPPGVGKTMIASAVASECGLNLISVKGPELLNKYIGASEQSVRDTFARARAATPCVLFFDEFESIAPKRGGDSTGVTDRVVNQFLCELDGVEARASGVYILAASSRPDLIDPALLRPGRIDKTIYLPFPTYEDRLDILQTVTQRMDCAEDVDLSVIAKATENYSSADLHAIVTTAQINSLHAVLDAHTQHDKSKAENGHTHLSDPKGQVASSITAPPLTAADLAHSLQSSAPSLSTQQRQQFERVYQKFISSKEQQPAVDDFDPKGKLKTSFA